MRAEMPLSTHRQYLPDSVLSRRTALTALALSGAGTLLPSRADAASLPPSALPAGTCVMTPEAEEGPFYFDPKLLRSDIAEKRPGIPLTLSLRLLDAGDCAPLPGARVDVW